MSKLIYKLLFSMFTCVFAFEDVLYVYGQGNEDMLERGKQSYMLLKERANLPKYGSCWQSAMEHVHDSCRLLSEDTQSDVALHLTNCFLEMSGHNIYECASDKKENLRRICLNSMSDRAFMVYTEFFTQTINICWFLRGQVWNEMIQENSIQLVQHMKMSSKRQEELLKAQEETLNIQQRLLKNEGDLEKFIHGLYTATEENYQTIKTAVSTMKTLQNWILGEISWLDSILFFVSATFVAYVITSTKRTEDTRLPIMFLLALNIFVERLFVSQFVSNSNKNFAETNYHTYLWYIRDFFIFCCLIVLARKAYIYKDYVVENNIILEKLYGMNCDLYNCMKQLQEHHKEAFDIRHQYKLEESISNALYNSNDLNGFRKDYHFNSYSPKIQKESKNHKIVNRRYLNHESPRDKYNLRSRGATPVT